MKSVWYIAKGVAMSTLIIRTGGFFHQSYCWARISLLFSVFLNWEECRKFKIIHAKMLQIIMKVWNFCSKYCCLRFHSTGGIRSIMMEWFIIATSSGIKQGFALKTSFCVIYTDLKFNSISCICPVLCSNWTIQSN